MIYLLYGEEYLIKKELNKIKRNVDISDISEYDLDEISLKNLVDDASSMSLFSNNRLIIANNSSIFTGSSKKRDDIKYLEEYLNNPNPSTTLVFIVNSESLDNRKKIVSIIKEKGKLIELNNYDIIKEVKEMLKGYNIEQVNIKYLIDRVGTNLLMLNQEINKIKTYKDNDLTITKEDIDLLTHKTVDIDIFHLIDNIILNKKKEALESYYEMIKQGEEPIKIIVMLSNQFRLMYQVKKLSIKRNSIFDMMSLLGQKKYPIEKALEKARKYSEELLLKKLYELANLDIMIKNGKINKNIALELFILDN